MVGSNLDATVKINSSFVNIFRFPTITSYITRNKYNVIRNERIGLTRVEKNHYESECQVY